MKTCCTCQTPQPESNFHRNSNMEDGLAAACKDCARARSNRWYRQYNKVKTKPVPPPGHHYCPKCKSIKPASDFYRNQAYCKECQKAYSRSRYTRTISPTVKRILQDPTVMREIEAELNRCRSQDTYEQLLSESRTPHEKHDAAYYERQAEKLVLKPEDIPEEAPDLY